jgi:hypothetical protein
VDTNCKDCGCDPCCCGPKKAIYADYSMPVVNVVKPKGFKSSNTVK